MDDSYVIVHRSYDPMQADILGQLLRENGIAARVLGTRHGAVIGVGQNILQVHIEVPTEQAGAATDFIESFLAGEGLPDDAAGPEDDAEPDEDAEPDADPDDDDADGDEAQDAGAARERDAGAARPRRPLLGAGSVLLMFGGSHLYAQRAWTTAVLAVGQVLALANLVSERWSAVATGLLMFGAILVFDLAGGQFALRQHNRGRRASALRQLLSGAAMVAVAGAFATAVGPHVPEPKGDESERTSVPVLQAPQLATP